MPSGSILENPTGWHLYWKECLSDSGIYSLKPLENSWYVPIRFIPNDVMKIYLSLLIENLGTDFEIDLIGAIGGGYVLSEGGKVLVWPGCCSDLSTISQWEIASEYKGETWKEIWIGHPCVSVRFDGKNLVISKPHEPGDRIDNLYISTLINPEVLQDCIERVKYEVRSFFSRLEPILEVLFPGILPEVISRLLIYGD